jgi:hypothetical protein
MSIIESPRSCSICLDFTLNPEKLIQICGKDQREICLDCYFQYVDLLLKDAYPGTCPLLMCPFCKVRSCLIAPEKIQLLPRVLLERYDVLAKSLLSLQCGSCHQRSPFTLSTVNSKEAIPPLLKSRLQNDYSSFEQDLVSYETGILSIDDFYLLLISKYFQEMTVHRTSKDNLSPSDESTWSIKQLLPLFTNQERRSTLLLRYLKYHPFILTSCCLRQQCFSCRTNDTHPGRSCQELADSRPNSEFLKCPTCSIHIVKGDGCDSVSCVCGARFTFSTELQKFNHSNLFEASFPHNTPDHCVQALCGEYSLTNISLAKAWYDTHLTECQASFLKYWKQKFPNCPTQAALATSTGSGPLVYQEYVVIAQQLWIKYHREEYQLFEWNQQFAQLSLWETFYPTPTLKREFVCRGKLNPIHTEPLVRCLTQRQRYTIECIMKNFQEHDFDTRGANSSTSSSTARTSTMQFLSLFGQTRVGLEVAKPTSDGIVSTSHLSTIDTPSHSPHSTPFNLTSLHFQQGYIVTSLLAHHEGSLGLITKVYEEDNTYEINWISLLRSERVHRNYLKLKGKGTLLKPYGGYSPDQMQMWKFYLKYLHLLLASPLPSQGSHEESKGEDTQTPSSPSSRGGESLSDQERAAVLDWTRRCESNGKTPAMELTNLQELLEVFQSGIGLERLCHLEELLPKDYSPRALRWVDLYGAALYQIATRMA